MHILVIEDEKKTTDYLRRGLSENGFVVDSASDGESGLERALNGDFDLVILDVMLPRRDGWSVLESLRNAGNETPVLFLTAREAVEARVKGLQLGADDYLVKPFAFSELVARVRTVLRRGAQRLAEVTRVGDLEIDFTRHKAGETGNGATRIAIGVGAATAIAIPAYIASHRGRDLDWRKDWPLVATGFLGLVVLSFDFTNSYEDAMRGVVQWNERAESTFNGAHPTAP